MTITATTARTTGEDGTGEDRDFTVPFRFLSEADLTVILREGTTDTVQTLNTHYTVSGVGAASGGTVTFVTAPTSSPLQKVIIINDPALTQGTDYKSGDPFSSDSHETALDLLTIQQQRTRDMADRSLKLSDGDYEGSGSFDASNYKIVNLGTPTVTTDAATKTYVDVKLNNAGFGNPTGVTATDSVTSRSLEVRFGEIRNVLDYGAYNNGTEPTATTTAIQLALNAASAAGGGEVFFPAGTYKVETAIAGTSDFSAACLELAAAGAKNITIRGIGATIQSDSDAHLLRIRGTAYATMWEGLTITGIHFQGNSATYKASGAMQGIYAQWVDDVEVVNCSAKWLKTGVKFKLCKHARAIRNKVTHCQIPIYAEGDTVADATDKGYDILYDGNFVDGGAYSLEAKLCDTVTIVNNVVGVNASSEGADATAWVDGAIHVIGGQDAAGVCKRVIIANNHLYAAPDSGIVVDSVEEAIIANNIIDFRDQAASSAADGIMPASDNTFTSASASFSGAGDTNDVGKPIIVWGAGTAGANLVTTIASVTSSTVVELTDAAVTTVGGGSPSAYWEVGRDNRAIKANAANAFIDGNIIWGSPKKNAHGLSIGDTSNIRTTGLKIWKITRNFFSGCGGHSIVTANAAINFDVLEISGNTFADQTGTSAGDDEAIYHHGTSGGDKQIDNIVIDNNSFIGCDFRPVYVFCDEPAGRRANSVAITNNYFDRRGSVAPNSSNPAIRADVHCQHYTLDGNTFIGSTSTGYYHCADNSNAGSVVTLYSERNNSFSTTTGNAIERTDFTATSENVDLSTEIVALADDATPSVAGGSTFTTGGTTTITDFDDGVLGQEITVLSEHAITITDGTHIILHGSANFVMAAGDSLTLILKADNKWYELSRMVNVPPVVTFAGGDATPTVAGGSYFLTAGTTAITDFDDGVVGQTITVKAKTSITITDGGDLELVGNFAMNTGDTITLTMFETGKWSEISRSNVVP